MLNLRFIVSILSVGTMVVGAGMVSSQTYPNKPIRIVTSEPGGSSDVVGRLITQGISGPLGQQLIVDNRPGGVIPGEIVSKSPPDGYTLLIYGSSFWIGPLLQNIPYDPVRDFSPIILATRSPNIVVVHLSLPVKSVKELIALAKARPGELNYASTAIGGAIHLAVELFKAMAGVNIVNIPYKGTAQLLTGLLGGHVQLTFGSAAQMSPQIKMGKLRALAVTSAQPSPLFPGLPTVAASGLPEYEAVQTIALFAPAKTPVAIINRLNQEIVRFLNQAEVKEKFLNTGIETVGSSPEQLAVAVNSEMARSGKIIKDAGIKAD